MNENDNTKFVDFDKYCPKCEYSSIEGTEDPCNECLTCPVNVESHKPIKFKENEN